MAELTVDPQGALAIRQVSFPEALEGNSMAVFSGFKILSHVCRGKLDVAFCSCSSLFLGSSSEPCFPLQHHSAVTLLPLWRIVLFALKPAAGAVLDGAGGH